MPGAGGGLDSANVRPWFLFELWGLEGGGGCPIFTAQGGEGNQPFSEEPWRGVGDSWWS